MIAPEDRPSAERMQEQIEHALIQEGIASKLEKWHRLPSDVKHSVADAVASALMLLPEEPKVQAWRHNRRKAKKWHWKECNRVKERLEEIARSEVVSASSIVFYPFEALLCPHGWNWSHCEWLGKMLLRLREATADSRRDSRLHELKKAGIDPAKACFGKDVCAPGTRDKCPPSQHSAPQLGRPPKTIEKLLLQTIVPCLRNAHWTNEMSFDFLAAVLIHCFGRTPKTQAQLALALGKLWRNLKRSTIPA